MALREISANTSTETRTRIHNITEKPPLKYGSEAWVLKKGNIKKMKAT
jgi:hypothetical protein